MKKITVILLSLLLLHVGLAAQTLDFETFSTASDAANGGPYASLSPGTATLLQNPAAFSSANTYLNYADVTMLLNGAGLSLLSAVLGGSIDFANMGTLLGSLLDSQGRAYIYMDMAGPLNFAYTGKGIGFGIYNQTTFSINIGSVYYAEVSAREDIVFTGGAAYRGDFGAGWWYSAGLAAKGLFRAEYYYADTLLGLMTVLGTPDPFGSAMPFFMTTGVGFDAGLQAGLYDVFIFGIQCEDAFSTLFTTEYTNMGAFFTDPAAAKVTTSSLIPLPNLSAGFTVYPFLNFMEQRGLKMGMSVNYSNLIDLFMPIFRNPILFLSAGLELNVLERLTISLGLREALLACGVTLNLDNFKFSTAVFGKELGLEPGERPVYNIMVGVSLAK